MPVPKVTAFNETNCSTNDSVNLKNLVKNSMYISFENKEIFENASSNRGIETNFKNITF